MFGLSSETMLRVKLDTRSDSVRQFAGLFVRKGGARQVWHWD
jgi:hypothetical protein